ncbi:hypothetical protein [Actinoallomurus oryzae]
MPDSPPQWLKVWATDVEPNDLVRFQRDGDAVRILNRNYPRAYQPVFSVTLPGGEVRSLGKLSKLWVFDPDGSVRRRVQLVIEEEPT